ncbi:hypothetical protein NL676_008464 [Syzygium grande]|nr:hypothetical protein NL676_008464 [Syzygium grande]
MPNRCTSARRRHRRCCAQGPATAAASQDALPPTAVAAPPSSPCRPLSSVIALLYFSFSVSCARRRSPGLTVKSHSHGRVAAAAARSGGDAQRLWPRRSLTPSLNRKKHGRRHVAQRRRPWPRPGLGIHGSASLAEASSVNEADLQQQHVHLPARTRRRCRDRLCPLSGSRESP